MVSIDERIKAYEDEIRLFEQNLAYNKHAQLRYCHDLIVLDKLLEVAGDWLWQEREALEIERTQLKRKIRDFEGPNGIKAQHRAGLQAAQLRLAGALEEMLLEPSLESKQELSKKVDEFNLDDFLE